MFWTNADRVIRLLRHRRGWRQEDLGNAAGVSRQAVSRLELRQLAGMTVGALCSIAEALGASVRIELRWRGEEIDRLADAAHAALQESVAQFLTGLGWLVRIEASFSHFGERGRCDIVAFHPASGIMLIVELKTALGDLQDTLGRLDVKVRLGPILAEQLGWPAPSAVVPALVLVEGGTARRLVGLHAALFARFNLRGRVARGWIRKPAVEPAPTGLLWYEHSPGSRGVSTIRHARVRKSPTAHEA